MGWNIELAFVLAPSSMPLEDVVPDVFEPTSEQLGFEDATSVQRNSDMCAANLEPWAVVIDVNCRLSSFEHFLRETSGLGEVFVFRVSDEPVVVHCENGVELERYVGTEAALAALGRNRPEAGEYSDGEDLAWALMELRTDVKLDDLRGIKYTVFEIA
jgi:hypothetical protein